MSMTVHRSLAVVLLLVAPLGVLTGCGLFPDQITDCDMSAQPVVCQRDERFPLAGTSIVVDELETVTEIADDGEEHARVKVRITLEELPDEDLRAQLHVVDPLTDETIVIEPDERPSAMEQTLTFDFGGRGFARGIQTGAFSPDIFVLFYDADREVTVTVMQVEYSAD